MVLVAITMSKIVIALAVTIEAMLKIVIKKIMVIYYRHEGIQGLVFQKLVRYERNDHVRFWHHHPSLLWQESGNESDPPWIRSSAMAAHRTRARQRARGCKPRRRGRMPASTQAPQGPPCPWGFRSRTPGCKSSLNKGNPSGFLFFSSMLIFTAT